MFEVYNILNNNKKEETTTNINTQNNLENEQQTAENNLEEKTENIENTENSNTNENVANTNQNSNAEKKVVTYASPSGFMGSSQYRVVLYSNKEVYVETFDGNGYEEQNRISQDLIAKNVTSIKQADDEIHYGEVIIEGGEPLNKNFGWITFE